MITIEQSVAAAGQFTGLVGAGLVTFFEGNTAPRSPNQGSYGPILFFVGLDLLGDAATVDFFLEDPADPGPGNARIRIGGSPIDATGAKGLTNHATVGCGRIPVPISGSGPPFVESFRLICITSGKTGDGTFTASFSYGPEIAS